MNRSIKIMQGVCLSMLIILIGFIIFYYSKLSLGISDTSEGMDETGLGKVLLIFVGGSLLLYTLPYSYSYVRLWKGKKSNLFHKINVIVTSIFSSLILLLILIYRRAIIIFFLGPLIIPLSLLFITSFMYIKKINLNVN